jgi:ferredoxin/flavodoxin---NADP+ reductase
MCLFDRIRRMLTVEVGRQQGTYKILGIRHLTDSVFVLQLERKGFRFVPGQCVNIGLTKEGINREYSTYSGVNDKKLEFLIKVVDGGMVSSKLQALKKGDKVSVDGAYGLFVLDEEKKEKKHIFVGSGTGIAPFHSFVKSNPKLDYLVLHGIRNTKEMYDKEDYLSSRYVACVSQEEVKNKKGVFQGRVTDWLKENGVDKKAVYYLCGNSEMINDVYDLLSEAGVNGSQIVTEAFF